MHSSHIFILSIGGGGGGGVSEFQSFRRGVRFEIESQMRTEHCQEEKEKLGAKIQVFKNTFHFKARTEESVMILLV